MLPDRHLMDLAAACDQAADPILQSATDMERAISGSTGWHGIKAATADRLTRGMHLKKAAQHLREDAHDTELQSWIAHRASGGTVILRHAEPVVRGTQRAPEPVALIERLSRALRRSFGSEAA